MFKYIVSNYLKQIIKSIPKFFGLKTNLKIIKYKILDLKIKKCNNIFTEYKGPKNTIINNIFI